MRRRALTAALAASAAVLLLASSPAYSAPSSLSFAPCPKGTEFSCATLPVPLDRTGRLPGTVPLSVERRLAGANPSRTAVIALAGGPGQAATPLSEFIAAAVAPALSTRDLLVFDQRGTGASGPLNCAALSTSPSVHLDLQEVATHCASELGLARGDYTTSESVADIEALRQAGGYEKLVLYGTSYGTKVALDYAERYPQNVEALVLDSTETPGGPEAFRVSTFKAMAPVLNELCSHGACNGVSSNPVADVAHLVARLSTHPLSGVVYAPDGKPVRISMSSVGLYKLLLGGDLDPALRAEVPAAVHAALGNDPGPLLRLEVLAISAPNPSTPPEEPSGEVDEALFVATTCEETQFPWQRVAPVGVRETEAEAALKTIPSSAFYPFNPESGLLDETIPLCVSWPDAAPAPPAEASLPNVPTLILSGGQDLRTPTENAQAVAKLIPDAQVLVVPYTGHSVIGSDLTTCAHTALVAFFAGTPVSACSAGKNLFPPTPLPPRSLSFIAPTHGVQGAPGRTLTAAVDSIRDLERSIVLVGIGSGSIPVGARFGGLRGGDARVTKSTVVLSHYSYVPGVQLSGTISINLLLKSKGPSATVGVTGSSAAAGQVRISTAHRFSGVLGGRGFSVHLTATTASVSAPGGEAEWSAPSAALHLPALARVR
ncbi:MAG TPA: alpha/beta fold hydrolase [Solirubrobacteraceae bacterium]|jgi:pimeloyl-ACP methyl ester carboxylesterase|nr:alpha/beta fold hydrolase [Solirubrobacteraceae bacterium]